MTLLPDDIWLAIITAFSLFVDKHSEEMRNIFVNHDGQEQLVGNGIFYTAYYESLVKQMSVLIDERTKNNIREWIEVDFSTSTPRDKLVSPIGLVKPISD